MSDKDKKEKTPEEFVHDIQEACAQLGWFIAMNDKNNGVNGLIIGSAKFLNKTVNQLSNAEEYEVWGNPTASKDELH